MTDILDKDEAFARRILSLQDRVQVLERLAGQIPRELGFRSVVRNGNFSLAQRGAGFLGITTTQITLDGWVFIVNPSGGLGTWNIEQVADTPAEAPGVLCWRAHITGGAEVTPGIEDFVILQQRYDGYDTQNFLKGKSGARPFALSFWVKSTTVGTYIAELYDHINTRSVSGAYTITAANVWQRKTIIFPADTTGAWSVSTVQTLSLNFWLAAGSSYSGGTLQTAWGTPVNTARAAGQTNLAGATSRLWQIADVQLEPGPVATEFELRPRVAEEMINYRHFIRLNAVSAGMVVGSGQIIGGGAAIAGDALIKVELPVPMRTTLPTVSVNTPGSFLIWGSNTTGHVCTALAHFMNGSIPVGAVILRATTGVGATLAPGQATSLVTNATTGYIDISSEI